MLDDRATETSAPPRVSVIVVAHENAATLPRCIEALRAQTFRDFEIVLVDNSPGDPAARTAAARDPTVRLIEPGENIGFAKAVNRAAAHAQGDHLAFINPDAYADPDWLHFLVKAADAHPLVNCFTSRQLMADDPGRLDGMGDVMSATGFAFRGGYGSRDPGPIPVGEVFSACGAAMLIDRRTFLNFGGFDERLFCYCEDVDLGYRLRLRQERILIVPQAVALHFGSASSGGARSDFTSFYGTRNRLWVFLKNTPPILLWLTFPLHIATTFVLFCSHAKHGELAAPWRGLVAALQGLGEVMAARRITQASREASSWDISRAMTWSARDLLRRRVVVRPHASRF